MVKVGYKQTEIGEIPNDWSVSAVKEIASVRGGKRLPKGKTLLDQPTGHPYIRVADMLVGGVDLKDIKYVPDEVAPTIKNYRIGKDDIFISVAGTLGIVGCVPEELDGANLTENADKITNIKINKNYLAYWLMSDPIQAEIQQQSTVGAQPKLALNKIQEFLLALPGDDAEQKAIVDALSDVDALIASLEKMIEKKRDIKSATMQQLLTGKKRLANFEGEWTSVSIGRHAYLKARIGWQALTTNEYLEFGDYQLVTGTDFKNGRIDWAGCWYVSEWRYSQDKNIQLMSGDVLITKDGTIGKVGYVEDLSMPATLNSGVFVIRPVNNSFHPMYLYYVLSSRIFHDFLDEITAGSTITHLYQKDFVGFDFSAPSIEEQKLIAEVLGDIDRDIIETENRLAKTKAIKQGMMQELLTGRTRLV